MASLAILLLASAAARAGALRAGGTPDTTPEERLNQAKPIAWVHIPKCGSSFINVLLMHHDICPKWPRNEVIDELSVHVEHEENFTSLLQNEPLPGITTVVDKYGSIGSLCAGGISTTYPGPTGEMIGNHQGINAFWNDFQGHPMTMLRQPEQRLLSAYYSGWDVISSRKVDTPLDYAKMMTGCQVQIMVRGDRSCHPEMPKPTKGEVSRAQDRISTGFAFVGIVEEWALSMCLFHHKFGGSCLKSDFINNRAVFNKTVEHEISVLKGFKDPYDGPLYNAALTVFRKESQTYDVNEEACKPCFKEAGLDLSA